MEERDYKSIIISTPSPARLAVGVVLSVSQLEILETTNPNIYAKELNAQGTGVSKGSQLHIVAVDGAEKAPGPQGICAFSALWLFFILQV